jgi:anti-anti-sigma factor
MEDKARVFAGQVKGASVIRLSGHATWKVSTSLKDYIEANTDSLLASDRLIFDLTQCSFLDSTMIGLICHLAVKYLKANNRQAVLLYSYENVKNLLELMNCHRIMSLVESVAGELSGESAMRELPGEAAVDKTALRECMLLAHKALVELNEKHISEFGQVIDDLKRPSRTTPPAA